MGSSSHEKSQKSKHRDRNEHKSNSNSRHKQRSRKNTADVTDVSVVCDDSSVSTTMGSMSPISFQGVEYNRSFLPPASPSFLFRSEEDVIRHTKKSLFQPLSFSSATDSASPAKPTARVSLHQRVSSISSQPASFVPENAASSATSTNLDSIHTKYAAIEVENARLKQELQQKDAEISFLRHQVLDLLSEVRSLVSQNQETMEISKFLQAQQC
jgi:hypothetical protein